MAAAMLLAMVVTAAGTLLGAGTKQQRRGAAYSQAQTSLRQGLRRALRTMRHGYAVIGTSAQGNLNNLSSSATQAIVNIPDAGGATIQIRIYVNGGNLYAQRSDQAAPGAMLNDLMPVMPYELGLSQIKSVSFIYYQTVSGVRSAPLAVANVSKATEVEMILVAQTGAQVGAVAPTTTATGYITMRNGIAGF